MPLYHASAGIEWQFRIEKNSHQTSVPRLAYIEDYSTCVYRLSKVRISYFLQVPGNERHRLPVN